MKKTRCVIAVCLMLCMLIGLMPGYARAEQASMGMTSNGLTATEIPNLSRLEGFDYNGNPNENYANDEMVTVIVVMDAPAVLDHFQSEDKSDDMTTGEAVSNFLASEEGAKLTEELLQAQEAVIQQILSAEQIADKPQVLSQWTGIVNGMAVRVPYGLLQAIRQMDGVKGAYVSNIFSAPENTMQATAGAAGYSYGMIGVDSAWNMGFTGAGMLVAVLDTGLDLDYSTWYDEASGQNVTGVRSVHEAFTSNSFRTQEGRENLRWTNASLKAFLEKTQLRATTGIDGGIMVYDDNALYKNLKVPYAADYSDGDVNVRPDGNNHGTHVAGTVAGYAEAEDGSVIFSGIAPDAQILAMKVFDDSGSGAPEYAILNALEDAALLGADVMNLSYGSTNGFSFDDTLVYEAYQRLNASGILFMAAAGNDGPSTANNKYGDLNLSGNPETSMIGAPSVFSGTLSVGSVDNVVVPQSVLYWTNVDSTETKVVYVDPFTESLKGTLGTGVYNVISVPGYGTLEDFRAAGFNDSYYGYGEKGEIGIALVKRGGTNADGSAMTFLDKINAAARFAYSNWSYNPSTGQYESTTERFVKAVIIYDEDPNSEELIYMSIDGAAMTAVFINGKDGNSLAAAAEAAKANGQYVTLTVPKHDELVPGSSGGHPSSFSSWGATPSLELKPEISAPGGNIWSSIFDSEYVYGAGAHTDYTGSYGMLSGTSMATPHMTGVSALVMQYIMETMGMTSDEAAALADNLMVSTAIPGKDLNGVYYSPRVQGAGLVNVTGALTTPAYISVEGHNVGKIELKDDPEKKGEYVLSFQVTNMTASELTYNVDVTVLVPGTTTDENGKLFMLNGDVLLMEVSAGTVTVPANGTATFTTTVTLSQEQKTQLDTLFPNGTYVEGFITLTNDTDPQIGLPFMGFYGDWTTAPIFDEHTWMDETEEGQMIWEQDATWGVSILGYFDGYSFRNLGQNPFDPYSGTDQWEYHEENITIAPNGVFRSINDIELYQLRDAKMVIVEVRDAETGELYYKDFATYQNKTYYDYYQGAAIPWSLRYFTQTYWDGTDLNGQVLPSGTEVVYSITAYGDGEYPMAIDPATGLEYTDFEAVLDGQLPTFNGHAMDTTGDVLSYTMLVDNVAPKLLNNTASFYEKDGRVYITGTFKDDGSIASVEIVPHVKRSASYNPEYYEYGMDFLNPFLSELVYDARVGEYTFTADVTEFVRVNESYPGENNTYNYEWTGNVYIFCGDYGGNDRAYLLNVNTEEGLKLSSSSSLVYVGDEFDLSVVDNTFSGLDLVRTSSDPSVATIDEFGHVVALAPGQTTITISNGEEEAVCIVAVMERPTEVIDFQLSIDHFSGLKPDGSIVVKVVNMEPADVVITENGWVVYEDDEEWAGLLSIAKDSQTGMSARISLNATHYGEGESSAGSGRLEVTINGVTRSMTFDWDDLYDTTDQDGLISNAYYAEQTVYVTQGETAELIAQYRQQGLHSVIETKLYTMEGYEQYGSNNPTTDAVGLVLDGPDFASNGQEWRGRLVALPGYELPAEIKVCTRYSYGYESEMYLNSYYAGYTYDPTTGEIYVQQAPYGADNTLVIRADGVAVEGAPGGTLSGETYTRPDGLYGPFDWTITDGKGELVASSKLDSYGATIDLCAFTPSEPGVSYITATSKDGTYSVTFAVICSGVKAESLSLDAYNVSLAPGQTAQLDVTMDPIPTLDVDKELIFTSYDESVATVDENGKITALREGYAYILITSRTNTNLRTHCLVRVTGCTEHTYGDWVVVEEPTADEPGLKEKTCVHCGHVVSEEIPAQESNPPTGDKVLPFVMMAVASMTMCAALLLSKKYWMK